MSTNINFNKVLGISKGCNITIASNPVTPLLFDTYPGAAVGFSLRKLNTAYTGNCIRVRRSSDNTELDIGFVNDVLDTASLLTFCGAGNGFVATWYDQSGSANNATQSTAFNQPQIVSSGAMITTNGKNSLLFNSSKLMLLGSSITVGALSYASLVGKRPASGDKLIGLARWNTLGHALYLWSDNKYYFLGKANEYLVSSATDTTTAQLLLTGQNSAGTMSIFKNSGAITSTPTALVYSTLVDSIGGSSGSLANCNLQETILYNSDQSTNRTGIETNINTFYTIYP